MRKIITLGAAVVLLNISDMFMTKWILVRGGEEANPLMALCVDGVWFFVIKVVGILLVTTLLVLAYKYYERARKLVNYGLSFVSIYYLVVVSYQVYGIVTFLSTSRT